MKCLFDSYLKKQALRSLEFGENGEGSMGSTPGGQGTPRQGQGQKMKVKCGASHLVDPSESAFNGGEEGRRGFISHP